MSFVELETDKPGLTNPIDAPPGYLPPPICLEVGQNPKPSASNQEAVFSSLIISSPEIPEYNTSETPAIPEEIAWPFRLRGRLEYDERRIGADITPGYAGETENGEEWFFGLTQKAHTNTALSDARYILNGASEDFTRRQGIVLPGDQHGNTLLVMAINFDQFGRILSGEEIPENIKLRCWVELQMFDLLLVNQQNIGDEWGTITNCGIIDMIGELPDGQLITNEVKSQKTYRSKNPRTKRRSSSSRFRVQSARHRRGLETLLDFHNPGAPLPRISQFMSIYDETQQNPNIVRILPKSEVYRPFLTAEPATTIYSASAAE